MKRRKIDLWVYTTHTADDNFIKLQVIKKRISKPHICNDHYSYSYYVEVVILWMIFRIH